MGKTLAYQKNPLKTSSQNEFVVITAKRLPQFGTALVSGKVDNSIPFPGETGKLGNLPGHIRKDIPFCILTELWSCTHFYRQ